MKLLAALLVVLCLTAQINSILAVGGFTKIDTDSVHNDATLEKLLRFSQTQFKKEAFADKAISSTDLTLEKITSVYTQVVSGENVEFNVEFTDAEGKPLYASMTVYYQEWTNTTELLSYDILSGPQ